MNIISPGTLCLLINDHPSAGITVSVVGLMRKTQFEDRDRIMVGDFYVIENKDYPGGWSSWIGVRWCAQRHQLLPIAPRTDEQSESRHINVSGDVERLGVRDAIAFGRIVRSLWTSA